MTRYRKRPVVIEAVRHEGIFDAEREPWRSFLRMTDAGRIYPAAGGNVVVETLEGKMIADPGDWIIRGIKGELYPCKPDIFEATYEKV